MFSIIHSIQISASFPQHPISSLISSCCSFQNELVSYEGNCRRSDRRFAVDWRHVVTLVIHWQIRLDITELLCHLFCRLLNKKMSSDPLANFSCLDELVQVIYQSIHKFVVLSTVSQDEWHVHLGLAGSEGRWWHGIWKNEDIHRIFVCICSLSAVGV